MEDASHEQAADEKKGHAAHTQEAGGTIALVDVDTSRLSPMKQLIEKLLGQLGKSNWEVAASSDRTEVMGGSNYLVNSIEVSGIECVRHDNDIPARYGIDQCIGDMILELFEAERDFLPDYK